MSSTLHSSCPLDARLHTDLILGCMLVLTVAGCHGSARPTIHARRSPMPESKQRGARTQVVEQHKAGPRADEQGGPQQPEVQSSYRLQQGGLGPRPLTAPAEASAASVASSVEEVLRLLCRLEPRGPCFMASGSGCAASSASRGS